MKRKFSFIVFAFCSLLSLFITSCIQIRKLPASANAFSGAVAAVEEIEATCYNPFWKFVYKPERLVVIEPCKTVTGKVRAIHRAPDGDVHLRIIPEDRTGVQLNFYNYTACFGSLVAEIICSHKGKNPKESCFGYTNSLLTPCRGDRVKITGVYVLDTNHGWREIHPISSIELLERR